MLTKFAHQYTQPFALSIAKGEVNDHSYTHKFGAVPAMSQNQTGTVWDVNDTVYPWAAWATPTQVTIPAVNASDSGGTVTLYGLDANYNAIQESLVVSSSTTVTSTKTFSRLYRAYFEDGTSNVGVITVKVGAITVLQITAGKAQTLMAIYTVPAGYTAYILKGVMSCGANADATGDMYVRYFGQSAFRVGHSFEVSGAGGQYVYDFATPIAIPEKSDIDIRASVRSNNARVSAAFDIVLVKNES